MGGRDLELLERVQSGDKDAFAELIRANHAGVIGLCFGMLGDRAQAEDASQEIFIKVYRSIGRFKGDCAISTWLYRIASNHCLDILRRRTREKADSLDAILEHHGGFSAGLPTTQDGSKSAETADLAYRALERLPEDYRLILTLREVQGLNYKELAETLDCTMDAVKARLKRARRSLKDIVRHLLEADVV